MAAPSLAEKNRRKLYIVLELASLEAVRVGKSYELLNCDKHKAILKKYNRDMTNCRPGITHQCLLMLLDSPLNRAGLLQVYIHTDRNVLIEVNPQTRIPRTFERFAGLIVQLLHKLNIRAADGPQKLLRVIKNPVSDHLPIGCRKILTSFHATELVKPADLIRGDGAEPIDEPVVFVVGAMAHGSVTTDYTERDVSFSSYPLSAALTCAKLCMACEEVWNIQ